jgi:hypothetical protein
MNKKLLPARMGFMRCYIGYTLNAKWCNCRRQRCGIDNNKFNVWKMVDNVWSCFVYRITFITQLGTWMAFSGMSEECICMWSKFVYTRWFKCDRDKLWLVYTQIVLVIFEPPCNMVMWLCICLIILWSNSPGMHHPLALEKGFWDTGLSSFSQFSQPFQTV